MSFFDLRTEQNGFIRGTTDTQYGSESAISNRYPHSVKRMFVLLLYFRDLHISDNRYRFICFRTAVPTDFIPKFYPIIHFMIHNNSNLNFFTVKFFLSNDNDKWIPLLIAKYIESKLSSTCCKNEYAYLHSIRSYSSMDCVPNMFKKATCLARS